MRIGDHRLSWGERIGYTLMALAVAAVAWLFDGGLSR